MQPGVQHWHTGGPSRGAIFNDDHLQYISLLARTSKRRLTLPGVVDKEEGDGVSDASRNWAKDGVGRPNLGTERHLDAMHDSCN